MVCPGKCEVCKLADLDLDMLVIAPHAVVGVFVFDHPDLVVDVAFQLQKDFSGVLSVEVVCSLWNQTSTSAPPRPLQG